jgi:hypothetical protein
VRNDRAEYSKQRINPLNYICIFSAVPVLYTVRVNIYLASEDIMAKTNTIVDIFNS